MSPRTENNVSSSPEFSKYFILELVFITSLILVGLNLHEESGQQPPAINSRPEESLFVLPWVRSAQKTVSNGLMDFSGKPNIPISNASRLQLLGALLTIMIVVPTLFMFSVRQRLLAGATGRPAVMNLGGLLPALGGVISISYGLAVFLGAIMLNVSVGNVRAAQNTQSEKDEIISELSFIALHASQYLILPTNLNGGNGSYEGYSLPKEFAQSQSADFVIKPESSGIFVQARSRKVPGAEIRVTINMQGLLSDWRFEGPFE